MSQWSSSSNNKQTSASPTNKLPVREWTGGIISCIYITCVSNYNKAMNVLEYGGKQMKFPNDADGEALQSLYKDGLD